MSLAIANICIDCADPFALATFWSAALDLPVDPGSASGDEEVGIALPTGQDLIMLRVPEDKVVKNRLHLCLAPPEVDPTRVGASRDAEVERVLALGATVVDDLRQPDGKGWVVLADPAGNEFCVIRPAEEQAG
ncbi:VOC family protein [Nocardioides zeae]|uniref:VOC family protein n=1 Tax=Nocardioides zeae TaxID=1457234 RepID=A0A6P0HJJ9_9ACTN|nr:VOC family protein [Nocardioides zeae]